MRNDNAQQPVARLTGPDETEASLSLPHPTPAQDRRSRILAALDCYAQRQASPTNGPEEVMVKVRAWGRAEDELGHEHPRTLFLDAQVRARIAGLFRREAQS